MLTFFGLFAVTAMLVCYALEDIGDLTILQVFLTTRERAVEYDHDKNDLKGQRQ